MALHPLAGKPAPQSILANVPRLVASYYRLTPDPAEPAQRVAFGTSGHRGCSELSSFNERHILAISQAVDPEDVRAVAHDVLRHRLMLSYEAQGEGVKADRVIDEIVELVALP